MINKFIIGVYSLAFLMRQQWQLSQKIKRLICNFSKMRRSITQYRVRLPINCIESSMIEREINVSMSQKMRMN